MDILSKTGEWPNEKLLPPDNGDGSVMLALGPEGRIGGPNIYDSSHLLNVQSYTEHFAFIILLTLILIL